MEGQGGADECLESAAASIRAICYVLFGPIFKGYHSHNFITTRLPQILACTHYEESKLLLPLSFSDFGEYVLVCPILPIFNGSLSIEGGLFLDFIPQGLRPHCIQGTGCTGFFPTLSRGLFLSPLYYCDLTPLGKRLRTYQHLFHLVECAASCFELFYSCYKRSSCKVSK